MPASTFLIDTPPDFNFDECLWFLDRNLDDCMHKVFPGSVRKLLDIEGDKILIEISEKNKNLQVRVLNEKINCQKEITSLSPSGSISTGI